MIVKFDEIYEELISYNNLDKKENQIECHNMPKHEKERICIFCGKRYPEVTFFKIAHAISETLGNKKLVSHYECDNCNLVFGTILEDALGKYVAPFKLISQIYGKKNTLTIKDYPKDTLLSYKTFRIETHRKSPVFDADGRIRNFIIEKSGTEILKKVDGGYMLTIPRQRYNPLYVYAALLKIGYSLLPLNEMQNWVTDALYLGENTRNYKDSTTNKYFSCLPNKGFLAFYEGINPLLGLGVHLYKRKSNVKNPDKYFKYLFQIDFFNFSITIPIVIGSEKGIFDISFFQYQSATYHRLIDFTKEETSSKFTISATQIEISKNQYNELEKQLRNQKLLKDKE